VANMEKNRDAKSARSSPKLEVANNSPVFELPSFLRRVDRDIHLRLSASLQTAPTFTHIIDCAANIAGCGRNEVCVLEQAGTIIDGRCSKLLLRHESSPMLSYALRSTGVARYDRSHKCWVLSNSDLVWGKIDDILAHFFKCILDVSTASIYEKRAELAAYAGDFVEFSPMPYHESVEFADVRDAISSRIPRSAAPLERMYIHNGEQFLPWEIGRRWTKRSFLLVRCGVDGGRRDEYFWYSVLAKTADFVKFAIHDVASNGVFTTFLDTCRVSGIPGFVSTMPAGDERYEAGVAQYQGGFARLQPALDVIHSLFPGIKVAPLCGDYMSLGGPGGGCDAIAHGVDAYAGRIRYKDSFVTRISEYFGYDRSSYPVVFPRQLIDKWSDDLDKNGLSSPGMVDFFHTIGHELAHHFMQERLPPLYARDHSRRFHTREWARWADLLTLLFLDSVTEDASSHFIPSYRPYSHKTPETTEMMSQVVLSDGLSFLRKLRERQALSPDCLCEAVMMCGQKFEEIYGAPQSLVATKELMRFESVLALARI